MSLSNPFHNRNKHRRRWRESAPVRALAWALILSWCALFWFVNAYAIWQTFCPLRKDCASHMELRHAP